MVVDFLSKYYIIKLIFRHVQKLAHVLICVVHPQKD